MTNPFAQPTAPAQQPAVGSNPFAAPAPAAPQQQPASNPFAAAAAPQAPVQPTYAPQQQPAAQQQGGVPQFGTLASAPAPVVGEGRGAQLADMYGRLVLILPLREDTVPRRPEHITAEQRAAGNVNQQRLTATVVVLDDGQGGMQPIAYGGKPYALPPTPHTDSAPLPYVRKGMWINQSRLISQCRDYLPGSANGGPNGAPGMVCGRVTKAGPNQNDPWYLIGANEAEVQLARKYLELVQAGQYPNPLA